MRAWRVYDFGDMRLDDVAEPEVLPGYVKLAIQVVQPSLTEIMRFSGGSSRRVDQFRRILEEQGPSRLFGHEFSGTVVAVGPGVSTLREGDRVAAFLSHISCGQCAHCTGGMAEYCQHTLHVGQHIPGAFAERAVIPATTLLKLPDSVSFNSGACVQPLMWCLAAVNAAGLQSGMTVAVLGQGAVGLGITQLARHAGASFVASTSRRPSTTAVSRAVGADLVIAAHQDDPVAVLRDLTRGAGVDVVFDTAGGNDKYGLSGSATLNQALAIAKPGGTVVDASSHADPVTIDLQVLQRKSLRLCFPVYPPGRQLQWMMALLADGRLDVERTITHRLPGLEQVPQAFAITANKRGHDAINPAQVVVLG